MIFDTSTFESCTFRNSQYFSIKFELLQKKTIRMKIKKNRKQRFVPKVTNSEMWSNDYG